MKVTFYATKPMARYVKRLSGLTLDRLPCDDPKLVGRVPLMSSPLHVAWQLHVVETNRDHKDQVIIAMEAFSRYVILIPVTWKLRVLSDLEATVMDRWLEELMLLKASNPQWGNDITGTVLSALIIDTPQPEWLTNTDLSINGHMTDTDHWIASELHHRRRSVLQEQDARDLAWYLNMQPKRLTQPDGNKVSITPAERLPQLCLSSTGLM